MKTLLVLLLLALLMAVSWPIALLFLLAWTLLWLLSLPFRIVGTAMEAVLPLVKAILFLPARLLGQRVQEACGVSPRDLLSDINLGDFQEPRAAPRRRVS